MENSKLIKKFSKLNLFDNNADLISCLLNVNSLLFSNVRVKDEEVDDDQSAVSCQTQESSKENVFRCTVCLSNFNSLIEQREHFQSDWHIFNIKRKCKNVPGLREEDYEKWISENESKSTASDDESSSSNRNVQFLQKKLKETGHLYFVTKENDIFACYRCLIANPSLKETHNEVELLESCRNLLNHTKWLVLSIAGGHFGGAVFEKNEPILHKTFSRYTVRAKQGGGQSAFDSQQSNAKSAGANLRRYNETALCQDIRELLVEWKLSIKKCQLIFIRCSSFHRYIFFGGSNPVFDKSDSRLRTIPFNTHRPTFEEIRRIHRKLATIICYGNSCEFLSEWSRKFENVPKPPKAAKSQVKLLKKRRSSSSSSSEEELFYTGADLRGDEATVQNLASKTSKEKQKSADPPVVDVDDFPLISKEIKAKIYTLVKTGNVEQLEKTLVSLNKAEARVVPFFNAHLRTAADSPTFLHLASSSGNCDMLRFLLELGADPTLKNGENKVAFQVANGKTTRQEFIKFRNDFPDRFDWNKAQVPPLVAVDPEVEAARNALAAEKRRAARKVKNEKVKTKKEEDAKVKLEEAERLKFLNLSDREKRALAAERRLLASCADTKAEAPVLQRCFKCAVDISGKVPFEYAEFRFCSVRCLQEHRKTSNIA